MLLNVYILFTLGVIWKFMLKLIDFNGILTYLGVSYT